MPHTCMQGDGRVWRKQGKSGGVVGQSGPIVGQWRARGLTASAPACTSNRHSSHSCEAANRCSSALAWLQCEPTPATIHTPHPFGLCLGFQSSTCTRQRHAHIQMLHGHTIVQRGIALSEHVLVKQGKHKHNVRAPQTHHTPASATTGTCADVTYLSVVSTRAPASSSIWAVLVWPL